MKELDFSLYAGEGREKGTGNSELPAGGLQ
jgi:hypothetical protein